MQKNAILLGGPRHGKIVAISGAFYECCTVKGRTFLELFYGARTFIKHVYRWEYRGGEYLGPSPGTVFGVYQKPK